MDKKENVYEKTEGTGEGSKMENGIKEDCRTSAPTVPTKFKDVDALVRAYSALQSEFTRRSQRLKELERKVENLEGESLVGGSGVEKLRKNAQARKAEMQRFDHFVAETERVGTQEDGQPNASDEQENALEKAATKDGVSENTTVAETDDDVLNLEKPTEEEPFKEGSGAENEEKGDTMYAFKRATAHFSDTVLLLPLLGNLRYKKGDGVKILSGYAVGALGTLLFLATFYGIYASIAPREHYAFSKIAEYFPALDVIGRFDLLFVYMLTIVLLFFTAMPLQYTTQLLCTHFRVNSGVLVSALINVAALVFLLFANRHYNTIYALISGKLSFVFWIIADMVPLFFLLLPKNTQKRGLNHA